LQNQLLVPAVVVSGGGINYASDHGRFEEKDGVYCVRKKVPAKLEQAISKVLGNGRPRVAWLKRSLRTKDLREANIRAKPVLVEIRLRFGKCGRPTSGRVQRHRAEPNRNRANGRLSVWMLEEDEEIRRDGTSSGEMFQEVARQLRNEGVTFYTPFAIAGNKPHFGLSDREILKVREDTD
jgi:hypothetical protein